MKKVLKSQAIVNHCRILGIKDPLILLQQYAKINRKFPIIYKDNGINVEMEIISHGNNFGIFYIDIDYTFNSGRRHYVYGGNFLEKGWADQYCSHNHIYGESKNNLTLCLSNGNEHLLKNVLFKSHDVELYVDYIYRILTDAKMEDGKGNLFFKNLRCKSCDGPKTRNKFYCKKCQEYFYG